MSNLENKSEEKSKFPLPAVIIALISLYFLYVGYGRFIVEEYTSAGFFGVVSGVLLFTAYSTYKKIKSGEID